MGEGGGEGKGEGRKEEKRKEIGAWIRRDKAKDQQGGILAQKQKSPATSAKMFMC